MPSRLACLAACAAALLATEARADDRARLASLAGVYASPAAEPWYGAWGTRVFTFAGGQWSLDFTLALDPAMARPVFRFRTGGAYTLGAPARVPGAFEADCGEDWKRLTLLTADAALAAAFGLAACGLATGIEADISGRGCANWKPVALCSMDHDLLALDATGGLLYGVRPRDNDMCTPDRRPAALLPHAVRAR
jgi:hypothetical protein